MTDNGRVSTKTFYEAQLKTNEKIDKVNGRISDYHSEVKVMLAELVIIKKDVGDNSDDINSLEKSDKKWGAFSVLAGIIAGGIAGVFGGK